MTVAFRWLERSIATLRKLRHQPPPSPCSATPVKTHKRVRSEPNIRIAGHESTSVAEGRRRHDPSPPSTPRQAASPKITPRLGTRDLPSTSLLSGFQRQKSLHRSKVLSPVPQTTPRQLSTRFTAVIPTQTRSSTPDPDYHIHYSPPSTSTSRTHSPANRTLQSRLSFQSLMGWRSPSVPSTASPSAIRIPSDLSFPSPYSASSSRVVPVRSVPDVLQHQQQQPTGYSWGGRDSFNDNKFSGSGPRASGWRGFGDFPRRAGDTHSLHSGAATDNEESSDSMWRVRGIGYTNSGGGWLMNSRSSVGMSRTSSGGEPQNVFSSLTKSLNPRGIVEPSLKRDTQEPTAGRPSTTGPLNQGHRYADTYDSDDSSVFGWGHCGPESQPGPSRVYPGEGDGDGNDGGADSDTSHHIEIARRKSTATSRTQNHREPERSDNYNASGNGERGSNSWVTLVDPQASTFRGSS